MNAKENNLLTEANQYMPLVILHPNHNGQTALDKTIEIERPKSFELMINLLEPFDDFNLSKMTLGTFPYMIKSGSEEILSFLNSAVYIPVTMQEPIITLWPSDLEEYIFPTHTVLVSDKMVAKELKPLTETQELVDF